MDAPLHVVAGVLRDAQGRVLLAQRPAGKADAGLWEFPGGKVEPGEAPLDALRRELHEELGLRVLDGEPLIRVPVASADVGAPIRLHLDTWTIRAFGGEPVAHEHNALAWVALDALRREFHEELGLRVLDGEALIRVPVASPDGGTPLRLHLDTWTIRAFEGEPVAHEHEALAWVALEALDHYPMPPADRPVVAALREPIAVLITPDPGDGSEAEAKWWRSIDAALSAGLQRLHLRLPDARAPLRARLAEGLAPRCRAAGARLYVHGDPGLARRLGLGLHWRSGQLRDAAAVAESAAHNRAGLPLSAAVHHADDIAQAEALGVDDLVLGPVKPTSTHPGHPGLGWDAFERLRAQTSLPVYALGGLGPEDLVEARQHGAQGVAGIRAFWPA